MNQMTLVLTSVVLIVVGFVCTGIFLTWWSANELRRQDLERQRLDQIMRANERPYPRAAGSPSKRVG